MFKKAIVSAVLSLGFIGVASASGFGAGIGIGVGGGGFVGGGSGYAESATNGGSMASGKVNGTGVSMQYTENAGGGYAGAGVDVSNSGVVTYTSGGSYAGNVSAGFTAGSAIGETAGAVGTDFSSEAFGQFHTIEFGAGLGLGIGFGSFGSF